MQIERVVADAAAYHNKLAIIIAVDPRHTAENNAAACERINEKAKRKPTPANKQHLNANRQAKNRAKWPAKQRANCSRRNAQQPTLLKPCGERKRVRCHAERRRQKRAARIEHSDCAHCDYNIQRAYRIAEPMMNALIRKIFGRHCERGERKAYQIEKRHFRAAQRPKYAADKIVRINVGPRSSKQLFFVLFWQFESVSNAPNSIFW